MKWIFSRACFAFCSYVHSFCIGQCTWLKRGLTWLYVHDDDVHGSSRAMEDTAKSACTISAGVHSAPVFTQHLERDSFAPCGVHPILRLTEPAWPHHLALAHELLSCTCMFIFRDLLWHSPLFILVADQHKLLHISNSDNINVFILQTKHITGDLLWVR